MELQLRTLRTSVVCMCWIPDLQGCKARELVWMSLRVLKEAISVSVEKAGRKTTVINCPRTLKQEQMGEVDERDSAWSFTT